jgi:hypothetical protein
MNRAIPQLLTPWFLGSLASLGNNLKGIRARLAMTSRTNGGVKIDLFSRVILDCSCLNPGALLHHSHG